MFRRQPSDVRMSLGDPAQLECVAYGLPEVEYTWYRWMGSTIVAVDLDDRVMELNGTLAITMTTREDAGFYRCTAGNDRGNVTSERVELTILGMTIPAWCCMTCDHVM